MCIRDRSTRIKEVKNLIDKVAESDLTVLITGENGVGKELICLLYTSACYSWKK